MPDVAPTQGQSQLPVLLMGFGDQVAARGADGVVPGELPKIRAVGGSLEVPAGVVAQVWRGARQARVARFLRADRVKVIDLDAETARAIGVMCGLTGRTDVVDGHVALHARRWRLSVLTSAPDDVAAFDPSLTIIAV